MKVYTDGSCLGNPGPGGWACIFQNEEQLCGSETHTTNNRMEMQAAIEALRALAEPSKVELFTDSQYLRKGICEWLKGWKARGWKTAAKAPVKNVDLWQALDAAQAVHQVEWRWVRGHSGHVGNERADVLANRGVASVLER